MSRTINATVFRIVGIVMILIALVNVVPSAALFGVADPAAPGSSGGPDGVGVAEESATEDAIESTGGLTSIVGPATLILAPVMIAIGVALLLLRRWEMFAAIALVLDALLKGANLLANVAVPDANASVYLVPIVILVVDLALAAMMWQQRSARRDDGSATSERARAS